MQLDPPKEGFPRLGTVIGSLLSKFCLFPYNSGTGIDKSEKPFGKLGISYLVDVVRNKGRQLKQQKFPKQLIAIDSDCAFQKFSDDYLQNDEKLK